MDTIFCLEVVHRGFLQIKCILRICPRLERKKPGKLQVCEWPWIWSQEVFSPYFAVSTEVQHQKEPHCAGAEDSAEGTYEQLTELLGSLLLVFGEPKYQGLNYDLPWPEAQRRHSSYLCRRRRRSTLLLLLACAT